MNESPRARVRRFLESHDSRAARAFAWFIQLLILASLIATGFETRPVLSDQDWRILKGLETFTVLVFSVEYLVRIWSAKSPLRFALSPLGIIDLLAILPFYLSLYVDFRSLRAVRLLRLARLLKLVRYNTAIRRFLEAFRLAREELTLFLCVVIVLLYLAAMGIYHFEHEAQPDKFTSVFSSLWWAVATLTTVGYGDVYPVTVGGRIFTFFILIIGLCIVSIPSGIFAAALTEARDKEMRADQTEVRDGED
ncbi:MAG: ion transporter [Verrucomicrobia bacterium]|nr:ion transporter [Verrucomicrobiota bacterium]